MNFKNWLGINEAGKAPPARAAHGRTRGVSMYNRTQYAPPASINVARGAGAPVHAKIAGSVLQTGRNAIYNGMYAHKGGYPPSPFTFDLTKELPSDERDKIRAMDDMTIRTVDIPAQYTMLGSRELEEGDDEDMLRIATHIASNGGEKGNWDRAEIYNIYQKDNGDVHIEFYA